MIHGTTVIIFVVTPHLSSQARSYDVKVLLSAKNENSQLDAILLWSVKMVLFGVLPLVSQLSLSRLALIISE